MEECRIGFLMLIRQGDPRLDTVECAAFAPRSLE